MAKLTFNSVVYLKSTHEKCYVRAIITIGQKKTYKLSNGMKVGIEELITELPVEALPELEAMQKSQSEQIEPSPEQPETEQVQPVSIPDQSQSEHPQSTPNHPQKKVAKKPTKKA